MMNIQNHKQKKKNKQVVNQIHGIKSLGCNARPSRMCAKTCVEYDSGWLAVTCEAIIETRSAQGLDCNNATHTNSLIILNPTHLSSLSHPVPFFFLPPPVSLTLSLFVLYTLFVPTTNF